MTLVALLLGLFIERLLTNILHLREPRWFDSYFDWGLKVLQRLSGLRAIVVASLLTLLLVIPVALVSFGFGERLHSVPYVLFAVFVLLLSLGPRDLSEEVNEYCNAVIDQEPEAIRRLSKELTESDPAANENRNSPEQRVSPI